MRRAWSSPLRAQVRAAIGLIVLVAVLLFAVPLGAVTSSFFESQAQTRLQRDATRGVAAVPDNVLEAGSPLRAPAGSPGTTLGVYDRSGVLVSGSGPRRSSLAAAARDSHEHEGHDGVDLAVVVPVLSDTAVAGSVRAALPLAALRGRVLAAWGLLGALGLVVLLVAMLLARWAARRIAEPFEQLTNAARDLELGHYRTRLPRWRINEANAAAEALQAGAAAVDDLLQHERQFVQHASHQLRTPLAGLMVHLEQNRPDVPAALERARQLAATIEDLVALRAGMVVGRCDPVPIAADAVARWNRPGLAVTLRADSSGGAGIAAPALRQSLDVLLDNAARHGRGPVVVTVEPHGDAVLVEVADAGPGFPDPWLPGTGLTLVSGLMRRAGASLLVRRRAPHPRVALLLPPAPAGAQRPDAQASTSKR